MIYEQYYSMHLTLIELSSTFKSVCVSARDDMFYDKEPKKVNCRPLHISVYVYMIWYRAYFYSICYKHSSSSYRWYFLLSVWDTLISFSPFPIMASCCLPSTLAVLFGENTCMLYVAIVNSTIEWEQKEQ
jgi:hypothetical protein